MRTNYILTLEIFVLNSGCQIDIRDLKLGHDKPTEIQPDKCLEKGEINSTTANLNTSILG